MEVQGRGFTAASVIYVNDEAVETIYVDDETLLTADVLPKKGDRIYVVQQDDGYELTRTAEWTYGPPVK